MNLFELHELFQRVQRCKNKYKPPEKNEFLLELEQLFRSDLPTFGELLDSYASYLQYKKPVLGADNYETVEELFQVIRQILYDAAYLDTHLSYKLMMIELVHFFTPVVLQRQSA